MLYRLVVLTHGTGGTLPAALGAFLHHASHPPSEIVIVVDGPNEPPVAIFDRVETVPEQQGFCAATRRAWKAAAQPGVHFAFYLEHDFIVTRDLPLGDLGAVLDNDPWLAQMQLMRDAVNSEEKQAGGLYESRRDQYEPAVMVNEQQEPVARYLEHRSYLTTNPSLMRRAFMSHHPWPDYPDQCEGRFGIDLVRKGYRYGVWGEGEPWCRHVGVRDGSGHSY